MIKHHPDDNMLTEYASGSLPIALSLSVCAHLQLCSHCRKRAVQLDKLGSTILNHSVAEPVAESKFSQLMERIRQQEPQSGASSLKQRNSGEALHPNYRQDSLLKHLPRVVAKLLPRDGNLKWQRVSSELKTSRLVAGQQQYEVAFQRIRSGGRVVQHDHGGMEVTLVLQGSFSDEYGVYSEGDFLVRSAGEVHRPTATQNQDCLCLTVVEAPVKVTGFLGKLINPFLRFHPA